MTEYIGNIATVVSGSTIDWYGHTSLVFFFQGCNLKCPFCFNGGLIDQYIELPKKKSDIVKIFDENIVCDAVVATGGEPTLQPKLLQFLFEDAKAIGLKTMLNTNGTIPKVVVNLMNQGLIDHVAMDVKAPLETEAYAEMTGVYPITRYLDEAVRETMESVKTFGIPLEIRTTVVPGTPSTRMDEIIESIRGYADEFHIQQYDNTNPYNINYKNILPSDYKTLISMGRKAFDSGIPRVIVKARDDDTVIFNRGKKDNPYIVL